MKLSKKCEYACLAMIELSRNYEKKYLKTEEIATEWNIPKKFLEQILIILKNSGYLKSRKGMNGGYKITKAPADVSLAEIIRLIDGALAPVECVSTYFYDNSPVEKHHGLITVFKDIRDYISNKLEHTNFEDLANDL